VAQPNGYRRRVLDDEIDAIIGALPAIAIEGPKGVGKTRTASQRAGTVWRLDDPAVLAVAEADPMRLLDGTPPVLLDEWQRLPEVWDLVRRSVDDGAEPGRFLLAGSASPDPPPTHSGAGRIVSLRMRPLGMSERVGGQTVSVADLLSGSRAQITGQSEMGLDGYVDEILASGLPGIRGLPDRARRLQLDGYLDRVIDRDIPDETGAAIRNPVALRRWMAAYAAASSTTTSFEKIRDAASAGHDRPPAKETSQVYRDALTRVWILDEVPAWIPSHNRLRQLGQAPKHQLADPALAARLLGVGRDALLSGREPDLLLPRDGTLLGALFESLVTLSLRVYAQRNEARIGHLRTARGRQEIDLMLERDDGRVLAVEVKLARVVDDRDVRHLIWLEEKLGDQLLDSVVITTGPAAYRRADGIAVVPLALLGP
jgi:predicted AAA+ superfamily ATPase